MESLFTEEELSIAALAIKSKEEGYQGITMGYFRKGARWAAKKFIDNESLKASDFERMKEALEEIANPIDYFQKELKEGKIDSRKAIALSNDAEYLKFTAKKALKRCTDYNGF